MTNAAPKGGPLPDADTLQARKTEARQWFEDLQRQIHALFEELEAEAPPVPGEPEAHRTRHLPALPLDPHQP